MCVHFSTCFYSSLRIASGTTSSSSSSSSTSSYDLFILDVTIPLRVPREFLKSDSPADASNSKKKSVGHVKSSGDSTSAPLVPSIHHIVGMFTVEDDKPPPNVDMGLIDWEMIMALKASEKKKSANATLSNSPREQKWSFANSVTGDARIC
jgi:hypothetical protein